MLGFVSLNGRISDGQPFVLVQLTIGRKYHVYAIDSDSGAVVADASGKSSKEAYSLGQAASDASRRRLDLGAERVM